MALFCIFDMNIIELAEKFQKKYAANPYREIASPLPTFDPTTSHPAFIEKRWKELESIVKDLQEGAEWVGTPLPPALQKKLKAKILQLYQSIAG